MKRLLKLWRTTCTELEDAILSWLYSSALARHKPEELDGPLYPTPWCLSCVTAWPCDRWVEVQTLAAKQRATRP